MMRWVECQWKSFCSTALLAVIPLAIAATYDGTWMTRIGAALFAMVWVVLWWTVSAIVADEMYGEE
ncbi:MAG: hypothetical protein ACK5SM_00665 [Sphingomonadales bacterium]